MRKSSSGQALERIVELSAEAQITRPKTLPSCIFKLRSDGSLHFVEAVQALDDAKARVQALAESWPGEYVIIDEATGERVSSAGDEEACRFLLSFQR